MSDAFEREWEIQEFAREAERKGIGSAHGDGRMGRYRLLARILRKPPSDTLPEDFAAQMAARVAASRERQTSAGGRFEATLLAVLAGILMVAAGMVFVRLGPSWVRATNVALGAIDPASLRRPLVFLGCIAVSWMPSRWPRRYLAGH